MEQDALAIERALRLLRWRVYVTNAASERLSLEQAVLAYLEAYLVERNFGHLKGKPLLLTPMYLQDDQRATGLTRLLSIALRVLALIEHVARPSIGKSGRKTEGAVCGQSQADDRASDNRNVTARLQGYFSQLCASGWALVSPYHTAF